MILFVVIVSGLVSLAQSIEIVFESFEQISGYELFETTLRVRKYNHTTNVMNGTTDLKIEVNDTLVTSTDLWHSRLGNQQFNHYPMKLPTAGACSFIKSLRDVYEKYIEDIHNLPDGDECPIKARRITITDMVFPSDAVPPIVPKGLWKVFIICSLQGREVSRFKMLLKVHHDVSTAFFHSPLGNQQFNHYPMKLPTLGSCASMETFHSILGNQQFNYYPMKLPTVDVCTYMKSLHEDYAQYLKDIINLPGPDECPIPIREIIFLNKPFPPEVLPKVLTTGLWKLMLITK
ncbi:uncharacterized protein LOC125959478 [Anopheles darlingi]|uniref:uncharacterized protein LOC125959478 n=1 Tax=Anopheles darlingi TaxID=43151 RepID=UPI0021005622|nr:uncharacterized protein LOC125959478 [Anopheles darlingi]